MVCLKRCAEMFCVKNVLFSLTTWCKTVATVTNRIDFHTVINDNDVLVKFRSDFATNLVILHNLKLIYKNWVFESIKIIKV